MRISNTVHTPAGRGAEEAEAVPAAKYTPEAAGNNLSLFNPKANAPPNREASVLVLPPVVTETTVGPPNNVMPGLTRGIVLEGFVFDI